MMPDEAADAGFTLLETLVALVILAGAVTLFALAVSGASGHIDGAGRLAAAADLGARVFAGTDPAREGETSGTDDATGLRWRRVAIAVGDEPAGAAGSVLMVTVDVFRPAQAAPLLQLRSALAGGPW